MDKKVHQGGSSSYFKSASEFILLSCDLNSLFLYSFPSTLTLIHIQYEYMIIECWLRWSSLTYIDFFFPFKSCLLKKKNWKKSSFLMGGRVSPGIILFIWNFAAFFSFSFNTHEYFDALILSTYVLLWSGIPIPYRVHLFCLLSGSTWWLLFILSHQ